MGDLGMAVEEIKAVKVVGRGAMGTVFLVHKKGCDQPLALKAMNKSVLEKQTDGLKRARVERKILSRLRHPFLPSLIGLLETEKIIGWVMDYCPGGDLNALRRTQSEKCFSESIIRFYAAEIVLALEHLHREGVVYRDLKPENVLLQADGHIMLTDFDLSTILPPLKRQSATTPDDRRLSPPRRPKRSGPFDFMTSCVSSAVRVSPAHKKPSPPPIEVAPSNTKTNSFVGTEEYVSPEMLSGVGHDFTVDWWALGVLLYEMVYGETPFKGANRKQTFHNILVKQPQFLGPWTPLRDLIQRLLIKEPRKRLGFSCNGADNVKKHSFFAGLDWDSVDKVSRPPFVPPPMSLEDLIGMQSIDVEEYFEKLGESKRMSMGSEEEICSLKTGDGKEGDCDGVF
ncbi:hypothetical protein SUGI_0447050 [Cryptomeria japonica]|uniref:serine/threonine-protein kinase OXI1 n=1 Tax=Cryptomeria japonica TaxID=3369 RepID=UPI002408BB92|nr:serine/threonine-protein kinase OXI1 [Cryptomeria japonica]GLJ23605.1 hypothetical protein SUGI_0447050 [Cryptomeria japonica]